MTPASGMSERCSAPPHARLLRGIGMFEKAPHRIKTLEMLTTKRPGQG